VGESVVEVDFSDPLRLIQNDAIWGAINRSCHPACRKLVRRVYHDVLPSVQRGQGHAWPGTQLELRATILAAAKVARRNIARRLAPE
jgi:hypothetical protein